MSVAVKSDGTVQAAFDKFIERFDAMTDEEVDKAVKWFSEIKENNHERLDDVTLHSLYIAGGKFCQRYGKRGDNPPAIIKKFTLVKLQQGKAAWGKRCQTPQPSSGEKMPWE